MADPATAQLLSAITAALADTPSTGSTPTATIASAQAMPYAGTTALAEELIALARSGGDTTALAEELVAMARSELPPQAGATLGTLETVIASGQLAEGGGAMFAELAQLAPLAAVIVEALMQGSEPEAIVASMAPTAVQQYLQSGPAEIADAMVPVHGMSSAEAPAETLSNAVRAFAQDRVDAGSGPQAVFDSPATSQVLGGIDTIRGQARKIARLPQQAGPIDSPPASTLDAWGQADADESLRHETSSWRQRLRDHTPAARERSPLPGDRSEPPAPAHGETTTSFLLGDAHDRLIAIETPQPLPLQVERFSGHEAVCEAFKFEIDCLSPSAFLDLQPLLGKPLRLGLRTASDDLRQWHGYCTQVAALGSDGDLARYRLTMEPWTAFLQLRRNALIFQDTDTLGVVERVFADYPQALFRSDATQALPTRAVITQYRETDWEFVTRLLAEAGLAWRFEHALATDSAGDCDQVQHTLVIFDRSSELPQATPATIRFHRIDATEAEDAICHFSERRQVVPDAVSTASWQPEKVEALWAGSGADPVGPHVPRREMYAVPRAGRYATGEQAQQQADLMLDALRLPQRLHAGAGSARNLAAGRVFTLSQHPDLAGQAFVPIAVEHVAVNNAVTAHASGFGNGIAALLDDAGLERGSYRNRFLAVPAGTPLVPQACHKPLAPGAQTARVVGLPNAAITATRDHQVRIQFDWQRGAASNAGGLTDAGSRGNAGGHAPGNERSGTWVRVAEWLAGPNWGSHTLPRIGSEVLVEFLHADIDQPLITGQLFNGEVAPSFALGDASNHPGTLSGLHHGSVDGSGHQQWVIDDARGQLRQRLATTLADSRAEIGYLIEHADHLRGGYRGQGFEIATAGWGNLHAGHGMLLSTSARSGHTGTQLDVTEAVGRLKAAEERAQALSEAATQQQVPALSANSQQSALLKAIDSEQDGKYSGSIGGQPATKPKVGSRKGSEPVERFAAPLLLAESPDSIVAATPNSAIAYAGGALHLTTQGDAHFAAGQTFAAVAGGPAALYAHAGPLRVIAANGPVTVQAHASELELLADQSVVVTATDDRIDVLAQTRIVLQAGQSQIVLDGGDIRFQCPGNFTVKASQHPWRQGGQGNVNLSLPNGLINLKPQRMLDFSG